MGLFYNQKQVNRLEDTLERMEGIMSEMSDAVTNLKKEFSETVTSIQAKLDELRNKINAGGDPALIADVNAVSAGMDALQTQLAQPEP